MQSTQSNDKFVGRTSRSRTVTKPLSAIETRRLEYVFQNAPSKRATSWNPAQSDGDVINIKNLLRLNSVQSQNRHGSENFVGDDRIVINVCGDRYETHRTTLELFPDTLLGSSRRRKYYDQKRKEYFFDRHRGCFQAILYYYQSNGRLRRPDFIPLDIFLEEITFFQLGPEALKQIRKDENIKEVKKIRLPKNRLRRSIWITMEYPDYSFLAKVVNIISLSMVLISTITLAIESLPQYSDLDDFDCEKLSYSTTTEPSTNTTTLGTTPELLYVCQWYYSSPFFIVQVICVGYFTIELLIRTLCTPSILDFVKDVMNWIDLLAVIPFYISLGIRLSGRDDEINSNTYVGLRLLRVLRLARVFKFFRVFKSIKSLRALATTVRESLLDFLIMIIILTLLGFLFGAAAYYAENDTNAVAFDSILKGTYWGIISITSVGYGDIAPITPIGRVIACFCALFGAATIGMLVSVLVDRYQRVYVRKLYSQEEEIDFSDYMDNENNDLESKDHHYTSGLRRNSKIEDPDARAQESAKNASSALPSPQTSNSSLEDENNMQDDNTGRIQFIIRYVENEDKQKSPCESMDETELGTTAKQTNVDKEDFKSLGEEEISRRVTFSGC
ncbi:unnamed protein product [Adineta ricciae]|nr:unnamed protein product [Adineta ricciae]